MERLLEMRQCTKKYKSFKLGPLSMSIPRGMISALIGRNGSGKTTLLKGISGLSPFQQGELLMDGEEINFLDPKIRTKMTYISNDIQMYEHFTGKQALEFVGNLHMNWDHEWTKRMIETFQLDLTKQIRDLSKGMKMKLNLILGLGHKPKLILLDEPTDGLDSISRQQFFQMLQQLIAEDEERAILLSTHYTKEVEGICDYVFFLKNGSLTLEGIVDELKESYRFFSLPRDQMNLMKKQEIVAWSGENELELTGMIRTEDVNVLPAHALLKTPSLDDLFYFIVERGKRE